MYVIKIVSRGVYVWIKGLCIFSLPLYLCSLSYILKFKQKESSDKHIN